MAYDPWNRLTTTESMAGGGGGGATVISGYSYNALGWRVSKTMDTARGAYDGVDQARVFLYDASWRMIEEHVDTDLDDIVDHVSQQFWGVRYIDDAVAKRVNRDLEDEDGWINNESVTTWYQLTDSQFSVVAVLDSSGHVYERIEYDAYGNARHRYGGDTDGDGRFYALSDLSILGGEHSIGDAGYHADFDVNLDGHAYYTTSPSDLALINAMGPQATALPGGWISDPSSLTGPDNSIGYCGYVFNPEREDYLARHRIYMAGLGRWGQRDPIGYVDGTSMVEYTSSNAIRFLDPYGLSVDIVRDLNNFAMDSFTFFWQIAPGVVNTHGSGSGGASKPTQAVAARLNGASLHSMIDGSILINKDAHSFSQSTYKGRPGHINAARHGYWQAMLACKHGPNDAKAIGDAHEAGMTCTKDSRVDQYNNEVARQIGSSLENCSRAAVEQAISQAMNEGKFIVDENDPRLPPAPPGCDDCEE